jgi:phosphoribosylformylglycinamidine synthase
VEAIVKGIRAANIIMLPGGFSVGDEPDGSGKFIAAMFRNPRIAEEVMRLLQRRDGLMLGICNGFQALIKLGLVPYGEIRNLTEEAPTLTHNTLGRHVSCMVRTKVASNLSPWFNNVQVGDVHTIAVSHGEGRFATSPEMVAKLRQRGQIATQYVDEQGQPTLALPWNPNGSVNAIEGITSPDGRVLGKMGHSERIGANVARNIPGEKDQQLFEAGVRYYK